MRTATLEKMDNGFLLTLSDDGGVDYPSPVAHSSCCYTRLVFGQLDGAVEKTIAFMGGATSAGDN